MESPLNRWLTDLSVLAAKEDIIIEAQYFDVLDFLFRSQTPLERALNDYKDTVRRIKAIRADFNNINFF